MNDLLQWEQENPFDRQVKERVIALAREQGLMAEVSAARFRLLEYYALTESQWLDWLQDEPSLDLYRKALKDFCCKSHTDPKVAYEWVKFCQLQAAGVEGSLDLLTKVNTLELWDLYRAGLTDSQAIRETFEAQLSLPGPDLPGSWRSYQEWEQDKVRLARMQERYLQVFAISKKAERLFAQVKLDVREQATQVVTSHIEELTTPLSLSAGMGVYEQALVAFPTLSDLWRSYISFLVHPI